MLDLVCGMYVRNYIGFLHGRAVGVTTGHVAQG